MHVNHIKNTEKLTQNLGDKQRENAYLYKEIRERRNQKEEFERSCKENCQACSERRPSAHRGKLR